jgi:hypothetical protein
MLEEKADLRFWLAHSPFFEERVVDRFSLMVVMTAVFPSHLHIYL